MHCASCGHKLEESWTACPFCGSRVGGAADAHGVTKGDVSQTALIRDTLAAEYEIIEELGRGGMAIVFRAREIALDREVAVKVLPFSLAFDGEFVERFQREARTAAQLEHPNIIPIYRVGRTGQVIFFVMKLVRGGSLGTLLEGGGRIPPSEIRRILVESGKALNYASEKGIVHRDIKPDNIMFDEHGASVITDFGIAKAASGQRLTSTGMSIGTPHYMSPEQARAQETDGRSDIYSLGVVAYQALMGEVPYDGEDSFAIGYKHIMDPIPEPVLNTPDERRLYVVIRKMLAKDPADRFQSGLDLVEEIEGRPAAPRRISGATTRERLAAMPTTPMPKETVDALKTARPAMQRSAAARELGQQKSGGFLVWLIVLLVVAAGGVFAVGKMGYGPLALGAPDEGSGAAGQGGGEPIVANAPALDTVVGPSVLPDSVVHDGMASDSATAQPPRGPAAPPNAGPPGFLRIQGLPRGSTVLVDEVAPDSTPIRLSPGPHIVAISAPQHVFYVDTVNIRSALELTFTPLLTPVGEPLRTQRGGTQTLGPVDTSVPTCDRPGPGYNKDQVCWDVRPLPVAPPRVPVPADMTPLPGPAVLLVQVSAGGATAEVAILRPSESDAFNRLASAYAVMMRWRPATKDGLPVVGWTQIRLEPINQ
jgi:hypothetical protein